MRDWIVITCLIIIANTDNLWRLKSWLWALWLIWCYLRIINWIDPYFTKTILIWNLTWILKIISSKCWLILSVWRLGIINKLACNIALINFRSSPMTARRLLGVRRWLSRLTDDHLHFRHLFWLSLILVELFLLRRGSSRLIFNKSHIHPLRVFFIHKDISLHKFYTSIMSGDLNIEIAAQKWKKTLSIYIRIQWICISS